MQITSDCSITEDDIIAEDESTLERTVHSLQKEAMRYGLMMNADKTKTMVFGDKQISSKICIDGIELENVKKFTRNLKQNGLELGLRRKFLRL